MSQAARQAILAALRADAGPLTAPPEIRGSWLQAAESAESADSADSVVRLRLFEQMVEAAGGRCRRVAKASALQAALAAVPEFAAARRRVSLVRGAGSPNIDVEAIGDPRELADVDYALLEGVFGVAENGAVWIDGSALRPRSVLVLPEHLGIVVPAAALVDHMHAAYERLSFDRPGFGCFVSGPSKTADIEQALVIGAHGARSLTVFLLEDG